MEKMLNIKINNMPCTVPYGTTILEAARMAGIEIPTLCFLKEINEIGACRFCVAEVKGARSLVAACVYPIERDGTEIFTNTEKIRNSRRKTLELILSTHNRKCLSCVRSGECELQKLCKEYGVEDEGMYDGFKPEYALDDSAAHMIRDNNKCILCRRCVAACNNQGINVIGANARGIDTHIGSAFELPLGSTSCVSCGQCIVACPVGALYEKSNIKEIQQAIAVADSSKKPINDLYKFLCRAIREEWEVEEVVGYIPRGHGVMYDMQPARKKSSEYARRKNPFNNFEQNEYDFEQLELLLGN